MYFDFYTGKRKEHQTIFSFFAGKDVHFYSAKSCLISFSFSSVKVKIHLEDLSETKYFTNLVTSHSATCFS